MRAFLKRCQRLLADRIRYQITRGGVLFVFAMLVVGAGAAISANNLLFLILSVMLATLLVSGLVSRLCLAGLELVFLLPEHIPARRAVPGRLRLRNRKLLMPSFSIRVEGIRDPDSPTIDSRLYFPLVAGGREVEETVEVRFPRRGAYRQNGFAFFTSFPFGFLEKTARVTLRHDMLVYPSIDPQPGFEDLLGEVAGEIETHYRGLGRDFYRIRPYEMFESARHVDWKATAHTGGLQVREFAREQEQTAEIFLDRDIAPADAAWFEHAIDGCAFLAWRLAAGGANLVFRSQGYYMRLPEDGSIYTILRFLALTRTQQGGPAELPTDENSYKIVFTAAPQKFPSAAWTPSRILTPAEFPVDAPADRGAGRRPA